MKSSKRILSLLLVLTMLLGAFSLSVSAVGGDNETEMDGPTVGGGETGDETTEPDDEPAVTRVVHIKPNYPDGSMPGCNHYPEGDTYTFPKCGWPAPAGYEFVGWAAGSGIFVPGETYEFGANETELTIKAVWKSTGNNDEVLDPDEDEDDIIPGGAPKAPKVGTYFRNAIYLNCTDNDHDDYVSWEVNRTYTPKWNNRNDVWEIYATVSNIADYVPGYSYKHVCTSKCDYHCDYYCNDRYCEYDGCNRYADHVCNDRYCSDRYCDGYHGELDFIFDSVNDRFVCGSDNYIRNNRYSHIITSKDTSITLRWNERSGRWYVADPAVVRISCGNYNDKDYCTSRHSHTIKYTDGVANKVIFKDKTYTVKNNAKTPTVKDPVRDGYRFMGWSPRVSAYATECVTYVAQWAPADAPALTTEHVAYLKGFGKGYIRPEADVTRAEVATILYRLLDEKTVRNYYTSSNTFSDVKSGDWFNDAVSTLSYAGIIKGSSGAKFNPHEPITRAELTAMLSRFVYDRTCKSNASFKDVSSSYWACDEIALAYELGWIKGYGGSTFSPEGNVSRAEVAAIINRMLGRSNCAVKDTKNYVDNPVNAWFYKDILEASIAH